MSEELEKTAPSGFPEGTSLEARLGHRFDDSELLSQALTHRSKAHELGHGADNERLEFLGDAVLGVVAAEFLFSEFPEESEGRLAQLKSYLVSAASLAGWAREIGLGDAIQLGLGEARSGGRNKRSLLANAFEALLGAVYLDAGIDSVRALLVPRLRRSALGDQTPFEGQNIKTTLQELLQTDGGSPPEYRHVGNEGPDHEKRFFVECWVEGRVMSRGSGPSKKAAEREAAALAFALLQDAES